MPNPQKSPTENKVIVFFYLLNQYIRNIGNILNDDKQTPHRVAHFVHDFLCKFRAQGAGAQPGGRGAIGHGHPMRLGKYNKLFTKYPNRAKFHSEVNQSRFKNIVFNFTDLGG